MHATEEETIRSSSDGWVPSLEALFRPLGSAEWRCVGDMRKEVSRAVVCDSCRAESGGLDLLNHGRGSLWERRMNGARGEVFVSELCRIAQ